MAKKQTGLQKQLLADSSPEDRFEFLKNSCDKVEIVDYMKRFTPEQLTEMKSNLSVEMITLSDKEELFKAVKDAHKAEVKPLKSIVSNLLKNIRTKAEYVKEECFMFKDFDTEMIGYYNSEGELISSRPMRQEETQKNLFTSKTGTND